MRRMSYTSQRLSDRRRPDMGQFTAARKTALGSARARSQGDVRQHAKRIGKIASVSSAKTLRDIDACSPPSDRRFNDVFADLMHGGFGISRARPTSRRDTPDSCSRDVALSGHEHLVRSRELCVPAKQILRVRTPLSREQIIRS